MVSDLPHLIRYLKKQHVLSLSCHNAQEIWSANCFYLFDEARMVFWLMTEPETRHGCLMQANPQVSGTINGQPKTVLLIKGVQYQGRIQQLTGETEQQARHAYQKRFPVARKLSAPIWEIVLDELKMTDNALGFGKKVMWRREAMPKEHLPLREERE